ncbi:hypothetical protein [Aeromonas veronii]|uniref:hypothetical protein n=1 Tax=Aeromonas veronii TaxID=654 RepID=UPI00111AFEFC|nr:hypothetical protein [Aeromonas veronii]
MKTEINNGFIHPLIDRVIILLKYCNLVELFKYISKSQLIYWKKNPTQEEIISACNIAIDVYQVAKYATLIVLWACGISNYISKFIIYYLLFSNVFTYFYYHTWGSGFARRTDRASENRRFLNLIFAFTFYLLCYAYLYQIHYQNMINWPSNVIDIWNAIYLSVSNAFTLSSEGYTPKDQAIRVVFMFQHLIAFLFLAIIFSSSIPTHNGAN